MQVTVKLYATLRRYAPADAAGGTFVCDVAEGDTVADLLKRIEIPADHAGIVVIDGEKLDLAQLADLVDGRL